MPSSLRTEIEPHLKGPLGRPVRVHDVTGSTNTDAREWAEDGAPEGALVVADRQTAGRGRWGRAWSSAPGSSLLFSLILRPSIGVSQVGLLPILIGLACAEAIEDLSDVRPTLKWPNDVNIRGKKVAGVLAESRLDGAQVGYAIAGVGINSHWERGGFPPEIAERATSLSWEVDGPSPGRGELLGAFLARCQNHLQTIGDRGWAEKLIDQAAARSDVLGHQIELLWPDDSVTSGRAVGLAADGSLQVEASGTLRSVSVAEVLRVKPA